MTKTTYKLLHVMSYDENQNEYEKNSTDAYILLQHRCRTQLKVQIKKEKKNNRCVNNTFFFEFLGYPFEFLPVAGLH